MRKVVLRFLSGFMMLILFGGMFSSVFALKTQGDIANSFCGGNSLDVRESIILSAVTLCLPGLLEKLNEQKEFKCQRVKCIYNLVTLGNDNVEIDPSVCESEYDYNVCVYTKGEIFAIPPMSILEYFREKVAEVLANPEGAAYSVAVMGAREYVYETCKTSTCSANWVRFDATVLAINDLTSSYLQLRELIDNGFSGDRISTDACDGIGVIKKEIDKILNVLDSESGSDIDQITEDFFSSFEG